MTTAVPQMRFALGALLPLKGEDIVVLTVLPLQGEVPAEQAEGAPAAPEGL